MLTSIHSNRWIECPNTRNSSGNGLPMKKYVGAVVRKSSQLIIDEEIDHFENKIPVQSRNADLRRSGLPKKCACAKKRYMVSSPKAEAVTRTNVTIRRFFWAGPPTRGILSAIASTASAVKFYIKTHKKSTKTVY